MICKVRIICKDKKDGRHRGDLAGKKWHILALLWILKWHILVVFGIKFPVFL
jgi:hypothetical protein